MIELIILLIIIVPRIRALAKERKESALKWGFAAVGADLGAKLIMAVIILKLHQKSLIPQGSLFLYIFLYLLVISVGATGATLVIRQLRKKPITQS